LTKEEVGYLLGFQPHDIPFLVKGKFLAPLGKPSQQAPKWFSRVDVEALANDPKRLGQATAYLAKHWQARNAARGANGSDNQAA